MKIKQFKIYKCSKCKKRYKKNEMRAWYGADILLYDHQCVYCLGLVDENKLPKLNVPEKYQPYKNVSLDRNHPEEPTPIELLDLILDLIKNVERNLSFENLLGHARDYVELTIRELERGLNDV